MPLTGEAKAEHNRASYLKRKINRMALLPREMRVIEGIAAGKTAVQALRDAGMSPTNGTMLARLAPRGDLAEGLRVLLEQKGLTLDRVVSKVHDKLDSKRTLRMAGEDGEAIVTDDNDAQLRAVEIGLRLHERAGTLPVAPTEGQGGPQVQVIYQRITVLAGQSPPDVPDVVDACDNAIEVSQTTRNHAD